MDALIFVFLAIAALIGTAIGYLVRQAIARSRADSIEATIKNREEESRTKSREIVLAAKDKAANILDEAKKEERERQKDLTLFERRLNEREEILNQKISDAENQRKDLEAGVEKLKNAKTRIEEMKNQAEKEIERVAELSKEEAKKELMDKTAKESAEETAVLLKKLEKEKRDQADEMAAEIMIPALQRFSRSCVSEITTSYVTLPDDEMKGRIIGREGRNIRAMENLLGVNFSVDESNTITLSCFDPIRREIAKITLEKLIKDGRIQPAKIEEKYEEAKSEINKRIKEAGENAAYETGVIDLPKEIIYLLGRLNFRTSYGQNVLQHSIEAAHLAGMIAAELKANVEVSKKAALLHDIGKAIDHEVEGTHVELGRKILSKYGLDEKIVLAMQSHHDDYPYETREAFIVAAAEAASAARPGARRGTFAEYIKRLEELEKIATSFTGVEKAYAIHAGREIRVFVVPEKIDDWGAISLAKEIADRVQSEMNYPGEIKVNVVRETRAVEYAR